MEKIKRALKIKALRKKEKKLKKGEAKNLEKLKKDIDDEWIAIQENCDHDMQPVKRRDPQYFNGFKEDHRNVLIGWKCSCCNYFVSRPKGKPWEVCHACGGEMRRCYYRSNPKQQIRIGVIYRCECGHTYAKGPTEI